MSLLDRRKYTRDGGFCEGGNWAPVCGLEKTVLSPKPRCLGLFLYPLSCLQLLCHGELDVVFSCNFFLGRELWPPEHLQPCRQGTDGPAKWAWEEAAHPRVALNQISLEGSVLFHFRPSFGVFKPQTRDATASSKTITGQAPSFSLGSHPFALLSIQIAAHSEAWLIAKRLGFGVGGTKGPYFLMSPDEAAICPAPSTPSGDIGTGHPPTVL